MDKAIADALLGFRDLKPTALTSGPHHQHGAGQNERMESTTAPQPLLEPAAEASEAHDPDQTPKIRRAPQACLNCRKRKSRCLL